MKRFASAPTRRSKRGPSDDVTAGPVAEVLGQMAAARVGQATRDNARS
jgi:hypothetical protein